MSNDRADDYRNAEDTTASRLFDLRTIIGVLFVLYGVILFIAGLLDNDEEIAKAAGIRINLWLGLAMAALGGLFLLWVWLRPLHLAGGPSAAEQAGIADDDGPPGH